MTDTYDIAERLYDHHGSYDGLHYRFVDTYPLASLFSYRGLLRKLILDFKIRGRWQSGSALVEIFSDDDFVRAWVEGADYIMPVPSSIWSRWRGKHDLAFALAERLSARTGVPLLKPPRRSYFRLRKQSFRSRLERLGSGGDDIPTDSAGGIFGLRNDAKHGTNLKASGSPFIILVDDIVTSSRTLKSVAANIPEARYRFLTLATAYQAHPREDIL